MAEARSSIDADEIARFSAIAEEWWDPNGKFAPLHRFNPVRLDFIRERALAHFGRDAAARAPFRGLKLLDIGCGGGLLSEPMTRLGFAVTGVDASERNVALARAHAERLGLVIDYRVATAEALLPEHAEAYDLILNMEVVEHVADAGPYLRDCAQLIAPGGLMIVATLNRTLKALALAKIGAEYVLRWLPPETHDWRKFLTPNEVRAHLADAPVDVEGPFGVVFSPLSGRWRRSADAAVNYMMVVMKAPRLAAS
ncbi:MAG TPA: bifunctional 2-polyprenyl-6-hydroxyphenol methylase/3-demethylubiquinol 3-O-methyltransferase UbiG [Caulobacteraceae bacterium]|nr:bifunctional 2-polyprenyl-6-hydroxyphenol methylase/3-demethylubiquinol 3-O-methyltransferase UbiG [Caulobacteraceae bacterium]